MEDNQHNGGGNKVLGSIKETIGKVTGNEKLENKGRMEKGEAGAKEHVDGPENDPGAHDGGRSDDDVKPGGDLQHDDKAQPKA